MGRRESVERRERGERGDMGEEGGLGREEKEVDAHTLTEMGVENEQGSPGVRVREGWVRCGTQQWRAALIGSAVIDEKKCPERHHSTH